MRQESVAKEYSKTGVRVRVRVTPDLKVGPSTGPVKTGPIHVVYSYLRPVAVAEGSGLVSGGTDMDRARREGEATPLDQSV